MRCRGGANAVLREAQCQEPLRLLDTEGTELAGMGQVRSEAVRLTGEILRDMGGRFWRHPEWTLTVTDETGAEVLGLRVSANEPG